VAISPKSPEQRERLAAALRENLKRRKARARALAEAAAPGPATAPPKPPDPDPRNAAEVD